MVSPLPEGLAVVAIGGYGRSQMSPHSDIDLMLLHSVADPGDAAAELFRPLWDAKLRVGHAVRTVKEAAASARERFDTQTTLLTSRLVVGDPEMFESLTAEISSVARARPLRRHLVASERERRERNPYLLMETDVKTGRGGLRTMHGFVWERRREAMIGRFSTDHRPEEDEAGEGLLRIRNALHVVTGRSHDVFSTDLREPVARWLGIDPFEAATLLVESMYVIDRLATQRWPEVVEERPRGVWGRLAGKPPPLSGSAEPSIDDFVWVLETGAQGRVAFERMWESGLLDRVLPEWGTVRALPQLAPFHEHPVADHLWRTVDEMHALIGDDGHYGRIADELDSPRALLLAAFLHDIGKGRHDDHAIVGAHIAKEFCERMGLAPAESELVEKTVRHHLLLAMAATRRDIDDPAVIDEVAGTVGGLRHLQALYLLTVADSKATGKTMWSDWKATLVRSLFVRCAARLTDGGSTEPGTTREAVLSGSAARGVGAGPHLDGMPEEYLRSTTTDEVLWHLQLIAEATGVTNVGVRGVSPAERAVVVGRFRPGFRQRTAEALAANGIDVLEARLFTRADGMIVDTYRVNDDRIGGPVRPERWDAFRADLESGLLGESDPGAKLATRAVAYGDRSGGEPVVRASVDAASGDLVVVVKCADRIGRLAEILGVLTGLGLQIRLAQIDSREDEVVDTFHIGVDDPESVAVDALESLIAGAIDP